MKKLMSLLIALCLVLGLVPAMADGLEAVLAGEDTPVGADFACVIDENNNVYWQLAVSSFDRLSEQVPEGTASAKIEVLPQNGEAYPYLYPDGAWKIFVLESEIPAWFGDESVAKIAEAFEAWKSEVYGIVDVNVLLSFVNPQTIDVDMTGVSEETQALLDQWADTDSNWMVCYVRNSVPTTTQGAVGQSVANDAWNCIVNQVWTQTGEDLAGHSQVDLIASFIGSAFPGITSWEGYFGTKTGYPFEEGAQLLKAGYLYANGLYSAKQVKEFDDQYDPDQFQQLTRIADVNVSDTGSAFACLVDEAGNVYWSLGTDYVGGLIEELGLDPASVVALNVGPKKEAAVSVGTTYNCAPWAELGNGYFTTGAWEDAEAEKPAFCNEDGSATWRMNADGSIEPVGEDQSVPGGTVNPGKYTYQDGDTSWEIMLSGNGTTRMTKITAEDLAAAAAAAAEQKEPSTYFNTPAPLTEVKFIGQFPEWYMDRKSEIDELARKAYADWQDQILALVDVDSLNVTLSGMGLDYATPMSDELLAMFKEWVKIWNENAVAGSINIGISTMGYKKVGPSIWNSIDNKVLANYKSMDHEGCPGPTTSAFIAAYALEHYGKVIDAATDDYMGSTMNDVYSAHVGSFIKDLCPNEDGSYKYQVAHDLWEAGCIPFFDGEYWYLVSGPDFDPDGNKAVEVIYSATPAELLAD